MEGWVCPPKEMPPHTITDPLPNWSYWSMLYVSRTFSLVSPDSVTSVTCAQCELAFICEEPRARVVNFANLDVLWQMPNVLRGVIIPISTTPPPPKSSARRHGNWEEVCGHHLQNHSFIGGVLLNTYYIYIHFHLLSIPFAQQHVKLIISQCCFPSGQFDFTAIRGNMFLQSLCQYDLHCSREQNKMNNWKIIKWYTKRKTKKMSFK